MHSLRPFLAAAAILGAVPVLNAQPTPPLDPNTAIRIDFTGAVRNQQPEMAPYLGKQVSGSIFLYSPDFRPYLNGYDDVPELSEYWMSSGKSAATRIGATINIQDWFSATLYTQTSALTLSDSTYVSNLVGRVYMDQFNVSTGNPGGYGENTVMVFDGVGYDMPQAQIFIAGGIHEFTGKSIFGVPTEFMSITGINTLTAADFANPLNGFDGYFVFGPSYIDIEFSLTSLSATTVAIPEPKTYALALGAASLVVVGAMKWRRRQTNRA